MYTLPWNTFIITLKFEVWFINARTSILKAVGKIWHRVKTIYRSYSKNLIQKKRARKVSLPSYAFLNNENI